MWKDFTGKGVHVGVFDSGVQSAHWDLAANYDSSRHVTIDGQVLSGEPVNPSDSNAPHGTSVAGLIGAARNDRGGVGVAYNASLTGVNIFDRTSPIFVNGGVAESFFSALAQTNAFDVVNHSWGGAFALTAATSRSQPGNFVSEMANQMGEIARTGRDGLGTVSVAASGNSGTDAQANGYWTDRHVVSVSAYRQVDGVASNYSNHGASILVAAPSNDYAYLNGTGLVATDLLGTAGYNMLIDPAGAADYTDSFGGTSGASPIVAGVVTLMLDANESLGWRDVKNILAASAKMPVAFGTDPVGFDLKYGDQLLKFSMNEGSFALNGSSNNWNGGRMHFSPDYGYGAVDAYNAVRMAEVWSLFAPAKTSENEASMSTGVLAVGKTADATVMGHTVGNAKYYNDFHTTPTGFTFEVGSDFDVEHLDLTINYTNLIDQFVNDTFAATFAGGAFQSQFKLTAPDGTVGFATESGSLTATGPNQEMVLGFAGFRGAQTKGTWTLEFANYDAFLDLRSIFGVTYLFETKLTVNSIKLDAFGAAPTNDDVYTYTNEFFTMAAIGGEAARRTLVDSDGGTDWINASAVASDVKLSLVGGQNTSAVGAGRAFTIGRDSVIENAVTGDGNDTLIGNRFDNFLVGMRGNDVLNGGAGNDRLFGGTGNDKFLFDTAGVSGKDTILDWSGGDLIGSSKALRGAGVDGKITVAANATLLLDGTVFGDTLRLNDNGGAVLQTMGQKDGYFWYSYVSGANLRSGDVIREASFQPTQTGAGAVAAIMARDSSGVTMDGAAIDHTALVGPADQHGGSFYLYDAMAGSMSGGVLLHA